MTRIEPQGNASSPDGRDDRRRAAAAVVVSILVLVLGHELGVGSRALGAGAPSLDRSDAPGGSWAGNGPLTPDPQHATPASTSDAQNALHQRLLEVEASSGGHLGVAAVHVESGRRVSFNGGRAFPMASVRKLPIAMTVLAGVDENRERLDRRIQVKAGDLLAGTGAPMDVLPRVGKFLTVLQLLEVMLIYSDNTASATLQRAAASAPVVQARLHALGFDAVHVDREPRDLMREYAEVRQLKSNRRADAMTRLEADVRDSATPDAMADLLAILQQGRALSPASTELLLDIMRRCETGPRRLRAGLPVQVVLAHKTGTLGRTTNDVGIATLPDGTHLAIAAFITGSTQPTRAREQAIAAAAHQIYKRLAGRSM